MQNKSGSRNLRADFLANRLPNMTVAELLLEYLKLEGVDKVFGIPGGAVIYVANQLKMQKDHFDFIVCRQETGAAYIADGYHRVTGKLGVILTTAGPSAINAVTGMMNAEAGNSAVLAITGEVPEKYFGQGYLQEGVDAHLDVNGIYKNAVQSSALIPSSVSFQTLFEQALRNAMSKPRRAAHISLPNDVAGQCMLPPPAGKAPVKGPVVQQTFPFPKSTENYRAEPSGADSARMEEAFANLTSAKKPLILLGNGARAALRDAKRLEGFTKLVTHYAIPVMTSPDGKGIFPESHPMSLRNYGMTCCLWPEIYMKDPTDPEHFDALMVIGSSLGELTTSPKATEHYDRVLIPTDHSIQIDLDQSVIARTFPITLGIVAEAGAAIDQLIALGSASAPPEGAAERAYAINELKTLNTPFEFPEERDGCATPLHPAAAMRVVNDLVTDGHIFIDAGNCVGWSLNNIVIDPPNQFHIALGMGPMGFAVGAVVGGKIGAPDKDCVAIVGDGAFMMQGTEVSTAAQNNVGAVWIVLYDNDLSMVSQGMAVLFPDGDTWDDYYKLGAPDLVKFSEGLGADAVEVTKDQGPAEMQQMLSDALERARTNCKPQVVVLHIDPKPMPQYGWPTLPPTTCE